MLGVIMKIRKATGSKAVQLTLKKCRIDRESKIYDTESIDNHELRLSISIHSLLKYLALTFSFEFIQFNSSILFNFTSLTNLSVNIFPIAFPFYFLFLLFPSACLLSFCSEVSPPYFSPI